MLVLRCDFGALRARPYHAHAARKNVEQLGKFIHPTGADDAPHRRDPIIVVARGHAGDSVLFSVHAHAAELENLKAPSVLRQPGLPVEYGSAVSGLYRDGNRQHQGSGNKNHRRTGEYIKRPLDQQKFRRRIIPFHLQHGQMKQVHPFRTAHDYISNARNDIDAHADTHAVFEYLVAIMAMHAAEKHRVHFIYRIHAATQVFIHRTDKTHVEFLVEPVLAEQIRYPALMVVNNGRFLSGEATKIPAVGTFAPEKAQQ